MELKTIDSYFYKNLGYEISKIRHEKRKSLSEVAKKLDMTKQNLDNIELGNRRITKDKFVKLCQALDIESIEINLRVER